MNGYGDIESANRHSGYFGSGGRTLDTTSVQNFPKRKILEINNQNECRILPQVFERRQFKNSERKASPFDADNRNHFFIDIRRKHHPEPLRGSSSLRHSFSSSFFFSKLRCVCLSAHFLPTFLPVYG